ncbi:MAG: DUF4921 family protein [Actinomycetaceae bacterium]|nr:DUF4921 family protein [Actinomycetaceae bacterium]
MAKSDYISTKALISLPDGTVKQRNILTGTQVWTVPGRGNRPLEVPPINVAPLSPSDKNCYCAFCPERYSETPPEKSRIIATSPGTFEQINHVSADKMYDTTAEFRRIPNLFEIVSYTYWNLNHGHVPTSDQRQNMAEYLSTPAGFDHVMKVVSARLKALGMSEEEISHYDEATMLSHANGFFSGGHDVIVAKRHFVDNAKDTSQLASSGTLTPDEHGQYMKYTCDSMRDLYEHNPAVRYVVAFQNWLKPAGASFDHLHKQLVAIDEHGVQVDSALERLHKNPHIYRNIMSVVSTHKLEIAQNEHAVAVAGFGHRYPCIEIWPTGPTSQPWEASPSQVRGVSDLLHAIHAGTGPHVPCNEEWYHCPPDVTREMRWRILVKWRVSTLAGFEGGSRIYLNTISPWGVRDRLVPALRKLRQEKRIANLKLGSECSIYPSDFDQ